MQRLTGLDASFLYVETPTMHMHVALIAVLDPKDSKEGYSFERVHDRIEQEARRRPELHNRLVEVPFGIDHPVWVKDPHFDSIHHIRRVGCPAPHGVRELADLSARILSTPLDRARPLWEVWVVEGLAHGRFALVAKVHHSIADGMTGASLLASMFSVSPDAPTPPPVEADDTDDDDVPNEFTLLRDAVASRLGKRRDLADLVRRTSGALSDFYARRQSGEHRSGATLLDAPRTPWNAPITAQRSATFARVSQSDIKAMRKIHGATSNDIVLALCAGTLRRYLESRGELPLAPLVAACPIAVRGRGRTGGNQISALFTSLATNLEDPQERVSVIRAVTRGAKEEHSLLGGDMVSSWAELMAPRVFSTAARLYTKYRIAERHRPLYNVSISNVPGPRVPLYFVGSRLVAAYPLGPVVEGVGLNITVMSYADQVDFGFLAAANLLPHPEELAQYLPQAVQELLIPRQEPASRF
ncbi:MAG: wax ester/triacylglycerol synthase family O-acyltransferase [Myxococcales bacterium]